MKFLFYLLTLRWPTAYRYATKSSEAIEIHDFEQADPQVVCIHLPGMCPKRKVIKEFKLIQANHYTHPADLQLWVNHDLGHTPKELVNSLEETGDTSNLMVIPGKWTEGLTDHRTIGETPNGFKLQLYNRYTASGMSGVELLELRLKDAWMVVQQRQGGVPEECSNCANTLEILSNLTCSDCGVDVEFNNDVPNTLIKLYESIVAYEEASGKPVLKRFTEEEE